MSAERSTFQTLVALDVGDDATYQRYRDGMSPILAEYGGYFRWDFRIAEVLKGETEDPVNRVFVLSFPDAAAKEAFFTDDRYLEVRRRFFDSSVRTVARIAEFEQPADG